jgi:nucleoside-diphosphate-sugar epimerase
MLYNKKPIIAITGYTGFIGSNFLKNINHNNFKKIYLISRKKKKNKSLKTYKYIRAGYNFKNLIKYKNELSKVDFFFHFNYQNNFIFSNNNPRIDKELNLNPIKIILNILGPNSLFIFTSSVSVYGSTTNISNEKNFIHPLSNYDYNKIICERYISNFCKNNKINFLIFRLSNIYGNNYFNFKTKRGFVFDLVFKLLHNKNIYIDTSGNLLRDYLHINDCVEAFIKVFKLNKKYFNNLYNLTANKSYSIKKIINIVKVILKKEFKTSNKSKILYNCKKKILKTDLRNFKGVSNFYQSVSGWAPTTSFFNGLKMLIFLLKKKF